MSWRKQIFAILLPLTIVVAAVVSSLAEDFDWRTAGGQNFLTPVQNQSWTGTCWDFAAVGALEAKYKITRNDPTFEVDMSEQHLLCAGVGDLVNGGDPGAALDYFKNSGIVTEEELPFNYSQSSPLWPLQAGWQSRAFKISADQNGLSIADAAALKASLKANGPLVAAIQAYNDFYPPQGSYAGMHAVVVTGYHDDGSVPGGGYFVIKNSWGSGWGDAGYGKIAYSTLLQRGLDAITGAAYYTGAMATATWQGGSGNWSAGDSSHWTSGAAAYAWENKETAAVFNAGGATNAIAVGGQVIAHGLTFNPGATGYAFSGGGLTVTGSGIAADESVTLNSPVTIGAPQTWTTAAGKMLIVNGSLHTVISTLTVDGAGDTLINGAIDGGGIANSLGAAAGGIVKNGAGTLTLTGTSNCGNSFTLNSGSFVLAPSSGTTVTCSGSITGQGALTKNGAGAVVLSGSNAYHGGTTVNAGTLHPTTTVALPDVFTAGKVVVNGGGTLLLNFNNVGGYGAWALPLVISSVSFNSGSTLGIDTTTPELNGSVNSSSPIGGKLALWKLGTKTLTLSGANSYAGLTTVSGGTLQLVGAGARAPVLTGAGADIQGGSLVLDYTGGASPAATVQAFLAASCAASWATGQIRSSTAALNGGYALGWSDDTTSHKVTVLYTLAGDATLDGMVDVNDLSKVLSNYNGAAMTWSRGDVTYDAVVDISDLSRVLTNYNRSMGITAGKMSAVGGNLVPEPSTLVLLGASLIGLLRRARRREKSFLGAPAG